ncbi:MAG: MBOAT family protein [Acidobacteria bacterium]|nr:MBOAT family protein [Acidobacteriota bacterium]
MNFVSWSFAVLLMTVWLARLTVGRRKVEPVYTWILLVASLVFYGWHIPSYLWVLLASSVIDFFAALTLERPGLTVRARRAILAVSLTTNLGLLAFFKYFGFGLDNLQWLAEAFDVPFDRPTWEVVLPMGISFYTFQSMSYTIDVYRGVLKALPNFRDFIFFIAFFPQLVAGPIVRATEFLPQIPRVRRVRWPVIASGLALIVEGYFLKMVCADNLAGYVDKYWDTGYTTDASAGMVLWLSLLFSGQIFCDFAGYSQIARGCAQLLGYQLPVNFNSPYVAGSFKNFWERWHITLSRWLRDYLYVPLGGNRVSPRRTYVNLMLVMLLGGLWHGAAWTYVAWGALHGGALAVERMLGLHRGLERRPWWLRVSWALVVQVVVLVTWVFFRSSSFAGAAQFIGNVAPLDGLALNREMWTALAFLLPVVLAHAWTWLVEHEWVRPLSPMRRAVLAGVMVYTILIAYGSSNAFIYFQF